MIYIFDDYDAVTDEVLDAMIRSLPEDRRSRALSYRYRADRLSCAASYLLLCFGLEKEYGISDPRITCTERGKPYLTEHSGIHFNISHCRCGCAVIIHTAEAGIDIQDIVSADDKVIGMVCSPGEKAQLMSSPCRDRDFVRVWTMKEAYLKMQGIGIAGDMKKTDTLLLRERIPFTEGRSFIAAAAVRGDGSALRSQLEAAVSEPVPLPVLFRTPQR